MNPWPRRLLYLFLILVWFMLISIPMIAFTLAARQQIQVGPAEGNHVRLFLIQERDAEGIGLETRRSAGHDANCMQASVRYLMWAGTPENVTYCQCIDTASGELQSAVPGKCVP
jgi:hypothetical protein